MDLKAGMKVLDLGCGKALSSIFLAGLRCQELGLVPDASAGRAVRWIETIREDAGGTLGFTRMVARRRAKLAAG